MDVSIIYVNWNCAGEIVASIATVREWTKTVQFELIVVDNASPQGTGGLELDSGVRLIHSGDNRGFGAGCNLGARHASGRYLLFLNPDTRFLNDVLAELTCFLHCNPCAAVAGPLVVDEAGKVQFEAGRLLPTLFNEFLWHSTLAFRLPRSVRGPHLLLPDWDHLSTREVESVLGACMLVRSHLFKTIGGFDENFFLYAEELDLCCRFRKAGFQIWYIHSARLMHKERRSTMQVYRSLGGVMLQIMRSHHYYFRKHGGPLSAAAWRCMILILYAVRWLKRRDKVYLQFVKWALTA
jgi:hypothetical protein